MGPLTHVTIVGAGTIGTQIAMVAAQAGYQVIVYDTRPDAFEKTTGKLFTDLQAKGVTPIIPYDQWEALNRRVRVVGDLAESLKEADLVIEAVPENLPAKIEIFTALGKKAPAKTILASNSSTLPVSLVEKCSGRPEKCLNIHFYMPLQGMNMADVMGGMHTLPSVLDAGVEWVRSLGFVPLRVNKELLGFCFNRVWRAVKREVLQMWGDGAVDYTDIDRAWMIFTSNRNGPGPFGLMDNVGLDVIWDIEMVYYNHSKDPKDHPPQALMDKIKRGELGVKAGKGFYTYPNPEYRRPEFLHPEKPA